MSKPSKRYRQKATHPWNRKYLDGSIDTHCPFCLIPLETSRRGGNILDHDRPSKANATKLTAHDQIACGRSQNHRAEAIALIERAARMRFKI